MYIDISLIAIVYSWDINGDDIYIYISRITVWNRGGCGGVHQVQPHF